LSYREFAKVLLVTTQDVEMYSSLTSSSHVTGMLKLLFGEDGKGTCTVDDVRCLVTTMKETLWASQLLSNEYLHRRVREEGGAYGSGASASLSGEVGGFSMSSYRDPTPEKTIPVFEEAADWLSDVRHLSQRRVDEAKLRLFSGLDAPYTASSYGVQHFTYEMTPELKQSFRDALLAVGSADIARAADYLRTKETAVTVLQPEKSCGAETLSAA